MLPGQILKHSSPFLQHRYDDKPVGHLNVECMLVPRREELPEDFYELRKVPIELPRLPGDSAASCPAPMEEILEYLRDEAPGGKHLGSKQAIAFELHFVRTALVDTTNYWIWRFTDPEGRESYVTVALSPSGEQIIGYDESFGFTPEQFILADYYDLAPPSSPVGERTVSGVVMGRYRDAYLVARATTAIGGSVKFIGIALGFLMILGGIVMASNRDGDMKWGVAGVLAGLVVGIPLYVLGILVSAHGQVLKATLDTSVHTSPFLGDEQKAKVMSLH